MIMERKTELGFIQVHRQALSDIASEALKELPGVSLGQKTLRGQLIEFLGRRFLPGIEVFVGDKEEISIEARVFIQPGVNIPEIAEDIQKAIKTALDKVVQLNIKQINVNILGIERTKQ